MGKGMEGRCCLPAVLRFWLHGNVLCFWDLSQAPQLRIPMEPGSNFRLLVDQRCDFCCGESDCWPACRSIRRQARHTDFRRSCGAHLWVSEPSYSTPMALLCPRSFVGRGHRGHNDAHLREGHFELVRPKPRLGALNVILRRRTGRGRHTSIRAVTYCPLWMARSVFFAWLFDPYGGDNSAGLHFERRSSDKSRHHFICRPDVRWRSSPKVTSLQELHVPDTD